MAGFWGLVLGAPRTLGEHPELVCRLAPPAAVRNLTQGDIVLGPGHYDVDVVILLTIPGPVSCQHPTTTQTYDLAMLEVKSLAHRGH